MMPVRRSRGVTLGSISALTAVAAMTIVVAPADEAAAQLVGGSLSVSVPASANLSSGTTIDTTSFGAVLGNVTVTDTRTGAIGGWTASASATDFTTGAGSVHERIPKASISYWSGTATASSGLATFLPGQATALLAASLSSTIVAFSAVTVSGGTSATWRPTIVVTIPSGVVIGTYQGTITHSVS
jgi:hypothetical protein